MDSWTFFTGDQISAAHTDDNFDGRADSWFEFTDRYTYRIRTDTNFDGRFNITTAHDEFDREVGRRACAGDDP